MGAEGTLELASLPQSFPQLGKFEESAPSLPRVMTCSYMTPCIMAFHLSRSLCSPGMKAALPPWDRVPITLLRKKEPTKGTERAEMPGARQRRARTKSQETVTHAWDCFSHGLKVKTFYPSLMMCSEGSLKTSKAFLLGTIGHTHKKKVTGGNHLMLCLGWGKLAN